MFFRSFSVIATTAAAITATSAAFSQSASAFEFNMGGIENVNTTVSDITPMVKETSLSSINLDPMAFPGVRAHSGFVKVDRVRKLVTLIIQQTARCPKDMMCIQMMPAPIVIELPLISKLRDNCGTITYTAQQDQRSLDGSLLELIVKDNTKNDCEFRVALPQTEVEYSTEFSSRGTNTVRTHSTFSGGVLL